MQPFICCLIYAVVCFLIFDHIKVPKSFAKVISTVSDKTIGIYIFHFYFINFAFIGADHFGWHNWTRKGYFLFAVADSVVLFVMGLLIDFVRKWSYKRIERKVINSLPYNGNAD